MSRRILIGLLLVVPLLTGGLWWFVLRGEPSEDGVLTLYGNVDIRQVELGFRVAGRIEEMVLHEGDEVTAGTVLARLDRRPFEDDLALAEAQLAAEAANVMKLKAGSRPQEIEHARAGQNVRLAALENARRL